ncbi:MAG: DUF1838 family protein, partial [Rhodospirillaceae bacterium]|nr:DUF1838 family protein [Rhodospirillaceae bacterium]
MNLLAALSNPDASVQFGRRTFLSSAAMAGIGAVAGPAAAETTMADVRKTHPNFKWDDPVTANRVLTRMYGSLEPGKIAYLYFFGRGVGTTGPDDYTPLFRMISIAASISIPQPNGAIRYKAGQIILFTDWNTGEVLERWKNPYTEEMCDVFHYRDYPLDYTLDPNKMDERYTDPTDLSSRKLIMPWTFLKGKAYGDAFVKTKNKN